MQYPILMYILNHTPTTDPARALWAAERALAGGVNWITLRVRELPARLALDWALELRRLTREANAWLGVNPYPALAEWCDADALHLPETAPPYTPPAPMQLGRSVHSVEAAIRAQAEGCRYLLVGTMYPTRSHPHKTPEGLSLLRAVRQAASIPLVAVGGITPERVAECLQAGAQGVAVISGIADADDPQAAANQYWAALRDAAT
ncbi:MAG: thiamine phosphate synthase [Fimbriimonadales bacterium]|nr:thiamine phosphate synthase [Fimbriimonadales bacterium]